LGSVHMMWGKGKWYCGSNLFDSRVKMGTTNREWGMDENDINKQKITFFYKYVTISLKNELHTWIKQQSRSLLILRICNGHKFNYGTNLKKRVLGSWTKIEHASNLHLSSQKTIFLIYWLILLTSKAPMLTKKNPPK